MKVDIENVLYFKSELDKINKKDLSEIEWYKNGNKIDIDPRFIERFRFIGLDNIDFITSEFYIDCWSDNEN